MTDARTDSVPGRHRAGPARTPRRGSSSSGRKRWAAGAVATAVATGTLGVLTPPASASILEFGPIDPASNFPSYYTDHNGLSLAMCEDGGTLCLSGPEKIQDVHAVPGADAEAFYYVADAQTPTFVLHNALEAAYAGDGPGQEVVFMRTQVTARDGGLVNGATYNVKDPYGDFTCVAEPDVSTPDPDDGTLSQNACRLETEPVAGEFQRALGGRIGPFLTRDPAAPPAPAGYLGQLEDFTKVVGSPTGFNAFRVSGPGLPGTCTETDGTTIQNCQQTDQFFILGKIADTGVPSASVSHGVLDFGDVPATPAVTKTLTYANTGKLPVTISSIAVGGTNASAFAQTNNCPVAPATLDSGARCSVDVTFTPQVGAASAATLTIVDNTPAGTRDIALSGKNVGKMLQVEPPAGTALAFGDQQINVASNEINVVIGNTGKGPLTVNAPVINGFSAGHFRLGANNTCTTPVPSGAGCEISVVFRPTSTGGKTANLQVTDTVGGEVNIGLTGRGVNTDAIAPNAPTLSSSITGSTVSLSWTAATDNVGVTAYRLFRNGVQLGGDRATTPRTYTDSGLPAGSYAYTVRAVDAVGNVSVASNTRSHTVASNVAPTVTGRTPASNAVSVGLAANMTATFSEAVTGVTTGTFQVKNPAGTVIPGAVTQNPNNANQWILDPTNNLAADTRYTVTLTGGTNAIRDLQGAALTSTSWSFTTGPAPTVSARTPAVNATGVPRGNNITATFSEVVQNVGTATFVLRTTTGTITTVSATVTVSPTNARQWILNPGATLAANTQYRVTLDGGNVAGTIRDNAGNPLASDVTWTFTTGA